MKRGWEEGVKTCKGEDKEFLFTRGWGDGMRDVEVGRGGFLMVRDLTLKKRWGNLRGSAQATNVLIRVKKANFE